MKELPDIESYRPNVGICLFNRAGEVWLGERTSVPGTREVNPHRWQMPQGGIDKGEAVLEAAYRELAEETGVRSADVLLVTPGWLVYDFPLAYRTKGKKWRGQRQKWVAMLFRGEDDEVDLNSHIPPEFERWRWAELDEIAELIVPFKREVYAQLVEGLRPLAEFIRQGKD